MLFAAATAADLLDLFLKVVPLAAAAAALDEAAAVASPLACEPPPPEPPAAVLPEDVLLKDVVLGDAALEEAPPSLSPLPRVAAAVSPGSRLALRLARTNLRRPCAAALALKGLSSSLSELSAAAAARRALLEAVGRRAAGLGFCLAARLEEAVLATGAVLSPFAPEVEPFAPMPAGALLMFG